VARRKGKTDSRDKMIRSVILSCFSDPPLSQTAIAKQIGVDPSYVSKFLRQAREEGILELKLRLPRHESLRYELIRKYRLVNAVVVQVFEEALFRNDPSGLSRLKQIIGEEAARYLESQDGPLTDNAHVGVSCGETLLQTFMALHQGRFRNLRISPLTVEGLPQHVDQAPSTLVGLLRAKNPVGEKDIYGPQLVSLPGKLDVGRKVRQHIEKTVMTRAKDLDAALVGVGEINFANKDSAFCQILRNAGVNTETLNGLGVVGEINNRLFDSVGEDVSCKLVNLCDHLIAVPLSMLNNMVKQAKSVIAIAGGEHKVKAIHVALTHRYINILVTDSMTAAALLNQ